MKEQTQSAIKLLEALTERAKELACLYAIEESLREPDTDIDQVCERIILAIPPGWQFPDICQAKITLGDSIYQSSGFKESPWVQSADITVQDEILGRISIYYTEERPEADEGPFLKEERKLIETIAEQFGLYILHQQLKEVFEEQRKSVPGRKTEWWAILNLLKRTDSNLLMRVSRKMINYLCWNGVKQGAGPRTGRQPDFSTATTD